MVIQRDKECQSVMQKKSFFVVLLSCMFILGGTFGGLAQTVHKVDMLIEEVAGQPIPEFYFEPVGLFIDPGDTISFVAATPHHSVTAYHGLHGKIQRVPDGAEPFSSPMVPIGGTWEYTFDIPGVYDVFCAPHEQYGMVMRIVVGEVSGPGTSPVEDFSPFGAIGAAGTVLNDSALSPDRIVANGSVAWSEISAASKALSAP